MVSVMAAEQFWFNTSTHTVEVGRRSSWRHRMGPYPTREAAEQALERAARRSAEWDAEQEAEQDAEQDFEQSSEQPDKAVKAVE